MYSFVRTVLDPSVLDKPFILCRPTSPLSFTQRLDKVLTRTGQPPKAQYPEHPAVQPKKLKQPIYKTPIIPPANYGHVKGGLAQGLQSGTGGNETLGESGLVPQSVLMLRWEGEEEMNGSEYPAPLKEELKEKKVPLPPPVPHAAIGSGSGSGSGSGGGVPGQKQEKKIPK